ncbi:urease accessory protein UreH domain-containing protein [Paractinoplanes lichenicola]|uniref:Sulfite exporter TauE/SafE family protein n=1 Tax=Paractinoplanes lichenicola TaxID=2802976 RepID=A0ABS1VUF8_9ACTN|nr:sulfite exporter TauE/SafE family protein [Actinoplanes lichenicola]MBL7258124.1 sulfite exporter TauE/SafE family protein [Actinoplanes lichenicola]
MFLPTRAPSARSVLLPTRGIGAQVPVVVDDQAAPPRRRNLRRLVVVAALTIVGFVTLPAGAAAAHPLGNFSVNRFAGLTLHPDRIDALVVADLAELPTLQDSAPSCTEAAEALRVSADGDRLQWTIKNSSLAYAAGAGGLRTTRLECRLSASVDISRPVRVEVANQFRDDRIGWRELVASGSGVKLSGSSLPSTSSSNELRTYPSDPLASPADTRTASFTAAPDAGEQTPTAAANRGEGSTTIAGDRGAGSTTIAGDRGAGSATVGPATAGRAVGDTGSTGLLAGAERRLEDLVGDRQLTPLVGLLAVLLSLLLGAAHAALPGHGKTVMAAYLAGSQGRPRDAVLVGATVTFTHTAGVIALGLLLTTVSSIAGESVLSWLGLASGTLVAAVGVGALISALRRHRAARHAHSRPVDAITDHEHSAHTHQHDDEHSHTETHMHDAAHSHGPAHSHGDAHSHGNAQLRGDAHSHDVAHSDGDGHSHSHGHGHSHSHTHGPGKWGIAGIGVAGGLVPSPSALVVLLGAAALGRTVFGVLLVLAYGLGMAATLTAAGLLLVRLRHRLEGRWRLADRWRTVSPPATAALIIVVGLGLAGRALAGVA